MILNLTRSRFGEWILSDTHSYGMLLELFSPFQQQVLHAKDLSVFRETRLGFADTGCLY
jgi:hypothetical protein